MQGFARVYSAHYQATLMKKLRRKYYNKRITTCENVNA